MRCERTLSDGVQMMLKQQMQGQACTFLQVKLFGRPILRWIGVCATPPEAQTVGYSREWVETCQCRWCHSSLKEKVEKGNR
ncbi:MAG: hypothetical protein LAO31_14760 [Acidobacteriia bacterium]|nr:hypothetical protein [Terriglobia bacterium]